MHYDSQMTQIIEIFARTEEFEVQICTKFKF